MIPFPRIGRSIQIPPALLLVLLVPGTLWAEEAIPGGSPGKGNRSLLEKIDVPYADADELQTLDVFAPREAKDLPVVLVAHGGGWTIGDKNLFGLYRNIGRTLARQGFVTVMVNYRLSPKVRHPEHARDVARAFAWTRRHIKAYGGDPDRIVLAGHSSGAHLVALLATDPSYLKAEELKLTDRDRAAVRGIVAISGIYRIPGPEEWREIAEFLVGRVVQISGQSAVLVALEPILLETAYILNPFYLAFGDDKEARMLAAPLSHVRPGLPPFLVIYAESDLPGLKPMAREFHEALQKVGCSAQLCPIDNRDHNTIMFRFSQPNDPTAQAMLRFLHRILDGKAPGAAP